jgi:magnesium transporter
MRAKRGKLSACSPKSVLLELMDQKVARLADLIEVQHKRLEVLTATALNSRVKLTSNFEDALQSLAGLEAVSGKVWLCLLDTQRSLTFLQRYLHNDESLDTTCRDSLRDIDVLMTHTKFLFDRVNFLMQTMQGTINIQQNQIIKIFSIVAVVFMPPTLVASIYGMNFHVGMWELDWKFGYPCALLIMLLTALAPYFIFKRKGWL